MFIEPKMQSRASCAWDARVKDVTEACAPRPPLGLGVGKQGQLLLRGAPRGGGNGHSENTSPEDREEARAGHLGKRQAKNNPALSENMQERNQVGAGVKVLEWSSWQFAQLPEVFPSLYQVQEPGTVKANAGAGRLHHRNAKITPSLNSKSTCHLPSHIWGKILAPGLIVNGNLA